MEFVELYALMQVIQCLQNGRYLIKCDLLYELIWGYNNTLL